MAFGDSKNVKKDVTQRKRSSRRTLDSLEGQRTQLIRQIAAKEVAGEDGLGTGYGHLKAQIEVVEANIEDVRSRLA